MTFSNFALKFFKKNNKQKLFPFHIKDKNGKFNLTLGIAQYTIGNIPEVERL